MLSGSYRATLRVSCLMELSLKRRRAFRAKQRTKLRKGYTCFGCGAVFTRARALEAHRGAYWPGCPVSFPADQELMASVGLFLLLPVDNSVDKGIAGVNLMRSKHQPFKPLG